ncbi:XRE family transcriptional regulator [Mesorhizobium sp. CAU 1741]|uniref:helix-turn-helix domain-containing protein n=1 Tax=Mesorhizobium sp. CAU 1741 TaxID=3140366 RepID=UPI00325AF338
MEIGSRIRLERGARGWTLEELATRSGVSKAMLSKIERGESSPTAELLVRVAASFPMTLSALIARAEGGTGTVRRVDEQPQWKDPATGYVRRHLSPSGGTPLELIHVKLPAGATVSFPASSYTFITQQIWVVSGRLDFAEGDVVHELQAGDCLLLGSPADCRFHAPGPSPAEYLVAVLRR